MVVKAYTIGQTVEMKKPHPCGAAVWEIVAVGADIKLRCKRCKKGIIISRFELEKREKSR